MSQSNLLANFIEDLQTTSKNNSIHFVTELDNIISTVIKKYDSINEQIEKKVALLTHQEKVILKNVINGETSKEIGEKLFISKHTVDTHRRHILKKLGEERSGQLQKYAAYLMPQLHSLINTQ